MHIFLDICGLVAKMGETPPRITLAPYNAYNDFWYLVKSVKI